MVGGKGRTKPCCGWCSEKRELKYCLMVDNQKKDFCSEICLHDYKVAWLKVTCVFCRSEIRQNPVVETTPVIRDFCNRECQQRQLQQEQSDKVDKQKSKMAAFQYHYETSGIFNWGSYLKECNAKAAPPEAFRQHSSPPKNDFRPGMKIEANDPRNMSTICIATVVATQGPLLRLRLDGGDNKNDFWRLVDSKEIYPIGYCEKNGELVQPPLGFRMNPSSWPMFLAKTLNNADIAPKSIFVKEPLAPKKNKFDVGMKLEALDRKNPHLICPATVGAVEDENIFITFDGWRGAFDYWCEFDSRDIFPVGWCSSSGHVLQMPGNKAGPSYKKAKNQVPIPATPNTTNAKTNSSSSTPTNSKSRGGDKSATVPENEGTKSRPRFSLGTDKGQTKSHTENETSKTKEKHPKPVSKIVFLPKSPTKSSKEQVSKVASKSTSSSEKPVPLITYKQLPKPATAQKAIPKLIVVQQKASTKSAYGDKQDPKSTSMTEKPSTSDKQKPEVLPLADKPKVPASQDHPKIPPFQLPIKVKLEPDNSSAVLPVEPDTSSVAKTSPTVCAYVNHGCTCGPYLSSRLTANLPIKFGPGSLNRVLRETVQSFIDCAENRKQVFRFLKEKQGEGKVIIMAKFEANSHTCRLPPIDDSFSFWSYLEELFKELMCCENFYTSRPLEGRCSNCASKGPARRTSGECCSPTSSEQPARTPPEKRRWSSESADSAAREPAAKQLRVQAEPVRAVADASSVRAGWSEWSIDDVLRYICSFDSAFGAYSELFRKHEIDGKALVLLSSDMIMKYMGIKLGPALKICNLIDQLKKTKSGL